MITKLISPKYDVGLLPGIGQTTKAKLERLGIETAGQLITHWPRSWLDLTNLNSLDQVFRADDRVVVAGQLRDLDYKPNIGKRRARVTAKLVDDKGSIEVIWFNQGYLRRVLRNGQKLILAGKISWNWQEKRVYLASPKRFSKPQILPIYPATEGLSSDFINKLIINALGMVELPDIKISNSLDFHLAIQQLHQPSSIALLRQAQERLAQDEWNFLQYNFRLAKSELGLGAAKIKPDINKIRELVAGLPFRLTDEQRKAAWQLIQYLGGGEGSQALLQGEVGSGKTVVASLVLISCLLDGRSVAWIAPTRVLARQLSKRLTELVNRLGFEVELVLAGHQPVFEFGKLYVGTHALLDSEFDFGLVIIDEQHRFGVEQRSKLLSRSIRPHLLTMTATPIPRSLALAMIDQLKVVNLAARTNLGRKITTKLIADSEHPQAVVAIRKAIGSGSQSFIVVPRIEASRIGRSLKQIMAWYQSQLPEVSFDSYHGKLTEVEQEQVMKAFEDKKIDVLVTTSIIEVGINIPNATLMIIESAENFGLAQLHQLRGRVGRGEKDGQCIVVGDSDSERLKNFVKLNDGFDLAEVDLKLRGPGNLVGIDQTGWPRLRFARLDDRDCKERAIKIVEGWFNQIPENLKAWQLLMNAQGEDSGKILD
ncbi:DEAD/DEAH box helicase [Candidatus Berkelbacteria bacterium]|nr:DEAD/DEAH box helicase [Candidatus Berkelbacteria bacterium]